MMGSTSIIAWVLAAQTVEWTPFLIRVGAICLACWIRRPLWCLLMLGVSLGVRAVYGNKRAWQFFSSQVRPRAGRRR